METKHEIPRKFIRYEVLVNSMTEAFTFVMEHIDEFPTPNIEITGELGSWDDFESEPYVKFRVAVFGDIEGGF